MDGTFKETKEELFMKTNIRNITFDGIESDLLTMTEEGPMAGVIEMPFDKFGWFYGVREHKDKLISGFDELYNNFFFSVTVHIYVVVYYFGKESLQLKQKYSSIYVISVILKRWAKIEL